MFVSLLQLVTGSMIWKLRNSDADPPLLAGVQRATVVIVALQLVVFAMFGAANDFVFHRLEYTVALAAFTLAISLLLWRIWRTDILSDRVTMLRTAAQMDLVALLLVCAFGVLKANQSADARATGSMAVLAAVVDGNNVTLAFVIACVLVLLYTTRLWVTSTPPLDPSDCVNPVRVAHVEQLQLWNLACAALGLFGPPVALPCLAACVLAGSTLHNTLDTTTGPPPPEIFYRMRGKQDRFDMEY